MAIAILAIVHRRERPAETYPFRLEINAPRNATLDCPVVSPNGRYVAFLAAGAGGRPALWLRRLDSYEARVLPGTEGASWLAFWSPDSRSLAFSADGKLKRIELSGGPPQVLADTVDFRGGSWNSDGVIIFQPKPTGPLQRVAASGGDARPLELDRPRQETGQFLPSFLPDGNHFLYTSNSADPAKAELYLGSLDSKAARLVSDAAGLAAYSTPGFLLLRRGSTLVAHRFDNRSRCRVLRSPPALDSYDFRGAAPQVGHRMANMSSGLRALVSICHILGTVAGEKLFKIGQFRI